MALSCRRFNRTDLLPSKTAPAFFLGLVLVLCIAIGSLWNFFPSQGPITNIPVSAEHYKPMVHLVAKQEGLDPALLSAVITVESGFNPLATSDAGAMGLMQLMPTTARDLNVSNPFNPWDNVVGGARYLKTLLTRFNGNHRLALAAYNAGPEVVAKYRGVPPYKETRTYIKRVMQEFDSQRKSLT